MACVRSVNDFIDRGDSCSDSPASTNISNYEESFIDDAEQIGSPGLFVSQPNSPGLFVNQSLARQLFPESNPDSRRHSVALSVESEDSTPLAVLSRRRQGEHRARHSTPRRLGFEQLRRSAVTKRPFSRAQSTHSSLRHHSECSEQPEAYDSGDDGAFRFPRHLDLDALEGVGLASRRINTGRPRYAARRIMLTFSQAGHAWPYLQLVKVLEDLGAKYRLGRERHQDGGCHYHCYIDFERPLDFENIHRFCVGERREGSRSRCPGQTHCNILVARRTPWRVFDYAGKDGDILCENATRPPVTGAGATRDDKWATSMLASGKDEFLQDIKSHSPRDSVIYRRQLQYHCEQVYGSGTSPTMPRIEELGLTIHWGRYPQIRKWVVKNLPDPIGIIARTSGTAGYPAETRKLDEQYKLRHPGLPNRPRSLFIFGGTRLGKTDFATNLGPVAHFQKSFNLKNLLAIGVQNIIATVWDDISIKAPALRNDGFKSWWGGQRSFNTFDRFEPTSKIEHFSLPAIVLTNRDPAGDLENSEYEWLQENCTIVNIGAHDKERSGAISSATSYLAEEDEDY